MHERFVETRWKQSAHERRQGSGVRIIFNKRSRPIMHTHVTLALRSVEYFGDPWFGSRKSLIVKIATPKKVAPVVPQRTVVVAKPVDVPTTIDAGPNDGVYSDSRINPILKRIKLEKWISTFHEQSIDLDSLMELNEDDMKELGMRIGERKRLERYQREKLGSTKISEASVRRVLDARPVLAQPVNARPVVIEKKVIRCSKGHALKCLGKRTNGWACDARNEPGGCKHGPHGFYQSSNWIDWRCNQCDYDLCGLCVTARGG